jgi:hypothetical protein
MACEPSYTDCIRRRPESGIGAELALLQWVRAGIRCLPADLGRSGQAALTGLYSLSKHSYASLREHCHAHDINS